jgi:glycosyltransferase involved in cell wall biosynthesis
VKVAFVPSWLPASHDAVRGHFFLRHIEALEIEHDVVVVSPPRGARLPAFVAHVARLLAALQPDVVHAHVAIPAGAAALVARPLHRAPVVLTEHSGPLNRLYGGSRVRREGVRAILRGVDALAIPSGALEGELRDLGLERTLAVVPNPVPDRGSADPQPMRFVAVGLMDDRTKGFEYLLRAWARFWPTHRDAHLRIVGDGALFAEYRALALGLGVDHSVDFLGTLQPDGVIEELRRADAYVSASVYETFGYALVEAASLGTPAVATAVGAAPDVIDDASGVLVPPEDVVALAAALARFCQRRDGIDRTALRRRTLDRFGLASVCRLTTAVYDHVCRRREHRDTSAR